MGLELNTLVLEGSTIHYIPCLGSMGLFWWRRVVKLTKVCFFYAIRRYINLPNKEHRL